MSRADGTPSRLRRARGRDDAQAAAPRVDALDALLREVDDLRLTLETDLSLAASAVESGAAQVASDILSSDTAALERFESRSLEHLAALDRDEPRRRVRVPANAGPILVAAALVGVLASAAPPLLAPHTDDTPRTVAATDSLQRLQELAASGDTEQVREASLALHRQLAGVVAQAKVDPAAAQTALMLLTIEQSTIVRSGDSRALADVLQQSRALVRAIVAALPKSARTNVPQLVVAPQPKQSAKPKAQQPEPAKQSTSTSSPKPKSSSKPSSQPTPSATPEPSKNPYPLPSAPLTPR